MNDEIKTGCRFAGADWVEQLRLKKPISPLGRKAADLLGEVFAGIYHLENAEHVDWSNDHHIVVYTRQGLSTYDGDLLTRIVLQAHDRGLRVDLSPAIVMSDGREITDADRENPEVLWEVQPVMRIMLHARTREGGISQRHPTIGDVIKSYDPSPR